MRVVLDTNQHISAIIQPKGNPAKIIRLWRVGRLELAISPPLLDEFISVAHRPRIQLKYNLSDEDIAEYFAALRTYAIVVPGAITVEVVHDDPDDNNIIACAIDAEVDMIISGDRHLLSLHSYKGIPIVKAADFLSSFVLLR